MDDYGQGKDSYLVEILYTNGEICRKIFNNDNSKAEAREFLNTTQRDAKPLSIAKTKIRQVYSSDSWNLNLYLRLLYYKDVKRI